MFSNLIKDMKIGFLDSRAHKYLTSAVSTIQTESLTVTKEHLSQNNHNKTNEHLAEVIPGLDALVELKEKYERLNTKYKDDKDQLIQLATDWKSFTELVYKLVCLKQDSEAIQFQSKSKEIIERFNKLLE